VPVSVEAHCATWTGKVRERKREEEKKGKEKRKKNRKNKLSIF
jgi:hypothetical protein